MSDQETPEKVETGETKKSSMVYLISAALLLLVVGGGVYVMSKDSVKTTPGQGNGSNVEGTIQSLATPDTTIQETPAQRPADLPNLKGQKLSDTKFAANAHEIYPILKEDALIPMSGWDRNVTDLHDGTFRIDLIPSGSETLEGDSKHTFIMKKGETLYFVDLNPGDDSSGADGNKNDDIGIIVNANGIIQ